MTAEAMALRSAPASWGPWPPEQARFDDAARRALAAVERLVAARDLDDDPVIELWMHAPDDFATVQFAPSCETVTIGSMLVPALGLGWMLVWNPATGVGRLWEHRARFPFEQERLRDHPKTRVF